MYVILNNIGVYDELVPQTKKISQRAFKFEVGGGQWQECQL